MILKLSEIDPEDSVDLLDYFVATYYIIKDSDFMENVIEQSRDKDLMDLSINNFSFQMEAITGDIKDEMILNGSIMVILFIFCLIAMTDNVLQFISDAKREFAVHMMCGADKRAIIFRIIMQMWYIYIICCFCDSDKKSIQNGFYVIGFFGVIYSIVVPASHMDIETADDSDTV